MKVDDLISSIDWKFYATTDGCYVISDNCNVVVAYQCSVDNPKVVNMYGDSIYIVFLAGDMGYLLDFASNNIKNIIFERLDENGYKIYDFQKVKRRVLNKI